MSSFEESSNVAILSMTSRLVGGKKESARRNVMVATHRARTLIPQRLPSPSCQHANLKVIYEIATLLDSLKDDSSYGSEDDFTSDGTSYNDNDDDGANQLSTNRKCDVTAGKPPPASLSRKVWAVTESLDSN